MKKATAKAEQFFTRSGNESTKASRTGANLLGWGESVLDHLSNEEKRDCLKRRLAYLQGMRKDGHIGSSIGAEIQDIQHQMAALRGKIKSERAQDIPSLFMDICRETMAPLEFKRILDEANTRQRNGVSIEQLKRRIELDKL